VARRHLLITCVVALGASGLSVAPVGAATLTVTTLSDSGAGSLRQAIVDANASAGADTIVFDAGLTGTITLSSNLPNISDPLTITGPGEDDLVIDGATTYRPFWIEPGESLTISDLTLRRGKYEFERGSLIHNQEGTVIATDVTLRDDSGWAATFNLSGGSVATFTRCSFIENSVGIGGDHGTTPSVTSSTDTDYTNRTYVVDSLFEDNTYGIRQERFTKVTGSTFRNNVFGATIQGLNRTQILNSTFEGNTYAITHSNWTDTTWTSVGANNRFHDGNTFVNNQYAFSLNDGWNDGNRSQQWSTITNNIWDGENTWISATEWDGTTNQNVTKTTVNSTDRTWTESGNVIRLSTPPTTTPPPAPAAEETTTTTTTTTVEKPTTTVAALPASTVRLNTLPRTGTSMDPIGVAFALFLLSALLFGVRRRLG
jgi:LPXTG-motif cell wall-anchored protein